MHVKLSKCSFFQRKVKYLGHIIYKEGIAVDPEKIKVIVEWSTHMNVTNVRSFMGLERYYHQFIKGFSQIAHPITSL